VHLHPSRLALRLAVAGHAVEAERDGADGEGGRLVPAATHASDDQQQKGRRGPCGEVAEEAVSLLALLEVLEAEGGDDDMG